jgi:peptide deformylase
MRFCSTCVSVFILCLTSIFAPSEEKNSTQLVQDQRGGLPIMEIGNPVLRQHARPLTMQEITSPAIQNLIQDMKATMKAEQGVGLAAPQVGKSIQLILIEDMDHSFLTHEQLAERDRYEVPFHVVINPRLYFEGDETAQFFEGCVSVPGFMAIVPRAKFVRVECLNEKGEPVEIRAHGWYARILQHEIDHLNGILYIDRALLPTLMTRDEYIKLWKDKSIKEILDGLGVNS